MGLSGCYAMMKYLVLFVNLIFWVSGMLCFQSLCCWVAVGNSTVDDYKLNTPGLCPEVLEFTVRY
jgi:hypothetical protein